MDGGLVVIFTDMAIAKGECWDWSYSSYHSHLDHLLVSDDLFCSLQSRVSWVEALKIYDFLPGGWVEYENELSDHRPVVMMLQPGLCSKLD